MLKKNKKATKAASWLEVILGAILAVALGVVLGAAYMVTKPVTKVSSIPKDAPSGAVYYIEGSKDTSREYMGKRKSFIDGESVDVQEGELNAALGTTAKPPAPAPSKPGDKAPPPAADAKMIDASGFNVRIRDSKIQFSNNVTISLLGVSTSVIVQSTGTFVKGGSGYEYEPDSIYVGGCPVQTLLFVRSLILRKLLFTQPVPDDVAAAWSKLVAVSIEGSKLRLRAP